MIVYVYDNKTNEKKQVFKNVASVCSLPDTFVLDTPESRAYIKKDNIKLVVYGF